MNFNSALFESDLEEHGLDFEFLRLTHSSERTEEDLTLFDSLSETSSSTTSLSFFGTDDSGFSMTSVPFDPKSTVNSDFHLFPITTEGFNNATFLNQNQPRINPPAQMPMFVPQSMAFLPPMPMQPIQLPNACMGTPVTHISSTSPSAQSVDSMDETRSSSGHSSLSEDSETDEQTDSLSETDLPKEGNTFYLKDCYENGAPRYQTCHARFMTCSKRVLKVCGGGKTSRFDTRLCSNCRSKLRKKPPTECHVSSCKRMSNGYNRIFCTQHSQEIAPLVRCTNYDTCGNQLQDSISRKFCTDCLRVENASKTSSKRTRCDFENSEEDEPQDDSQNQSQKKRRR
eukprot:TRINITY_DN51_c0_g1_i1.p1 TRINITY_DN51_c0_g1~~TRINITY_DN51_c0_g1_i1.p1  ORF type:complete len:342 (-),score=61.27 TRINITY_DN51_c0_g1_i1:123-1148(-)